MLGCRFRHDEKVTLASIALVELPAAPSGFFASDNFSGVHPEYLKAIESANHGHVKAYGLDALTARATELFRDLCDLEVDVLFVFGGTGANVVALASLLGRAESILCTSVSHINVDETGAPEKILGVKLADVLREDGRLVPSDVHDASGALGNVHHVQPGVVSLTQATELGTLYSVDQISEVCRAAHGYGMRVHMDGARIANAVAALGGTAETFRSLTFGAGIDALSFGGTKNGMLNAEVVLLRPGLTGGRAEWLRKQSAQLPSKMRYVAAQFVHALETGLWLETAANSNAKATELFSALSDLGSLNLVRPSVNSLYPTLPQPIRSELQRWSFFWDWNPALDQVRWMTSWDTTSEDVQLFAQGVRKALTESQ